MKNNTLKINVSIVDMDEIDYDYFCEGLLVGIPKIAGICKQVDHSINRMCVSMPPYSYRIFRSAGYPVGLYDSALAYYDAVIEELNYKRDLIAIYNAFMEFRKKLTKQEYDAYVKCFINDGYGRQSLILPMAHSFMGYLQMNSDLSIKDLKRNPYVYKFYKDALKKFKRFINHKKKGEKKHGDDCSTNEKCYS